MTMSSQIDLNVVAKAVELTKGRSHGNSGFFFNLNSNAVGTSCGCFG